LATIQLELLIKHSNTRKYRWTNTY